MLVCVAGGMLSEGGESLTLSAKKVMFVSQILIGLF